MVLDFHGRPWPVLIFCLSPLQEDSLLALSYVCSNFMASFIWRPNRDHQKMCLHLHVVLPCPHLFHVTRPPALSVSFVKESFDILLSFSGGGPPCPSFFCYSCLTPPFSNLGSPLFSTSPFPPPTYQFVPYFFSPFILSM